MSGVNRLTGIPWHVERFARQEGDDRRHRSRCVNYAGRTEGYCSYYNGKCVGAAHCSHYAEKADTLVQADENSTPAAVAFMGIRELKLSEIMIDSKFINSTPTERKIAEISAYYKSHGELDKPVVVSVENGKYILQDKYLRFVVAKRFGLETVPAEMGTEEEIKKRDAIRKVGTLVWQQKHGEVGEVVDVTLSKVTVKYDDGRERTYDIHMALNTGNIRIL